MKYICENCSRHKFDPDWTVHPGLTIKEIVENNELSIGTIAENIGVDLIYLCNIISCNERVTPALAIGLEKFTGISAEFFMKLQTSHDLFLEKKKLG